MGSDGRALSDQTRSAQPDGPERLAALFLDAAHGRFPEADGAVEVVPAPAGRAEAVVAFTAHHVVAAAVHPEWVHAQLPTDDLGAPMRAPFLTALGDRLGTHVGMLDIVMAAPATGRRTGLNLDAVDPQIEHPRVARARRYRDEVRCFAGEGGLLSLGTGLAGRVEVSVEVDPQCRRRGRGTALAAAALGLRAEGETVFAQVSPGNVASTRCFLAAGYRPVAAEVLFLRP